MVSKFVRASIIKTYRYQIDLNIRMFSQSFGNDSSETFTQCPHLSLYIMASFGEEHDGVILIEQLRTGFKNCLVIRQTIPTVSNPIHGQHHEALQEFTDPRSLENTGPR